MQGTAHLTRLGLATAFAAALATALATGATAQDGNHDPEAIEQAQEQTPPVVAFANPDRFTGEDGAAIYRQVCRGCHMPEGTGAVGAGEYPPLADNPRLEFPEYPIFIVIHGQNAMPAFGGYLDDQQVAAVVSFIRTNFGNDFEGDVTAEQAVEAR